MRGGCLLAVGTRRARGSNKFSSAQVHPPLTPPPLDRAPPSPRRRATPPRRLSLACGRDCRVDCQGMATPSERLLCERFWLNGPQPTQNPTAHWVLDGTFLCFSPSQPPTATWRNEARGGPAVPADTRGRSGHRDTWTHPNTHARPPHPQTHPWWIAPPLYRARSLSPLSRPRVGGPPLAQHVRAARPRAVLY